MKHLEPPLQHERVDIKKGRERGRRKVVWRTPWMIPRSKISALKTFFFWVKYFF
jgi:hypothetical protein